MDLNSELSTKLSTSKHFVRGYLPFIRKDCVTHMHDHVVYVKERLYFVRDLSLKDSQDSYLSFWLALLHSVFLFFFFIDEVLSINLSANVFVIGDLNVHHKDWLTYCGGTGRLGKRCYNFSISNDLTQMVNFPTQIAACDSYSHALMDFFLSSDATFCSTSAFLPLEILITLLYQFPLTFLQTQNGMSLFITQLMTISCAYWDGFCNHLREAPLEDIFKLGTSAAGTEFCEWVQVWIDPYMPHQKSKVKF